MSEIKSHILKNSVEVAIGASVGAIVAVSIVFSTSVIFSTLANTAKPEMNRVLTSFSTSIYNVTTAAGITAGVAGALATLAMILRRKE